MAAEICWALDSDWCWLGIKPHTHDVRVARQSPHDHWPTNHEAARWPPQVRVIRQLAAARVESLQYQHPAAASFRPYSFSAARAPATIFGSPQPSSSTASRRKLGLRLGEVFRHALTVPGLSPDQASAQENKHECSTTWTGGGDGPAYRVHRCERPRNRCRYRVHRRTSRRRPCGRGAISEPSCRAYIAGGWVLLVSSRWTGRKHLAAASHDTRKSDLHRGGFTTFGDWVRSNPVHHGPRAVSVIWV